MRKNIVAGNWKMNTTVPEGVELAKAVVEKSAQVPEGVGLIIATPFTHLVPVSEVVKGTRVELSAENCADKEKGAYTGEVSAAMLASAGCEYTILGHSERRQYYGETDATLVEKVNLFGLSAEEMSKIIVAYEPVWAIGTGKTATAEQAQEIHACIRKVLADKFGAQVAEDTTILYGGSCKPSNAKELFACPDIDGGLIGGAALKADDFIQIALSF